MWEKIKESVSYLQRYIKNPIDVACILGSGLGNLYKEMQIEDCFLYENIPNFPKTTVKGHDGKLIFGNWKNKFLLVMCGRFHYYEGYSIEEVTFPIRVFAQLGIKNLIVSNAAGGVNPRFKIGDIMLIRDHINLFPQHPLRGRNDDNIGPRFLDMSKAYDEEFLSIGVKIAQQYNISIYKGVYVGLQGPSFETQSEYRMIRFLGGDAVGMSTVPEIIVARHQGIRCFGISVICDLGGKTICSSVSHEDVLEVSNKSICNIVPIIQGLLSKL